MRCGLVTYNIAAKWDVDTLLAKCKQLKMEGVELRTTHAHGVEPSLTAEQRGEVKSKFAASGVTLWGLGSVCEYHSPDPAVVQQNIQTTRDFIDLAVDVGAKGVKVRPNGLQAGSPPEKTLVQIGEALAQIGPYAQKKGVEIWVEVHGRETSHPPYMEKIFKVANHPSINACWNCNPTDLKDGSIREYFALLRPWIRSVHIHDLYEAEYPYRDLFALLAAMDYKGFLLGELPDSADPDRVVSYFRGLFDAYVALAKCG
jgi:sugar phosphate isomerase/epimerase